MKTPVKTIIAIAALLTVGPLIGQTNRTAEVQFKAAQHREEVEGDLKGAIELYERTIRQAGPDRALAAQALLRIADCYHKLGDEQARSVYEKLLREYPDQPDSAKQARAALGRLQPARNEALKQAARQLWTSEPSQAFDWGVPSRDGRYVGYTEWNTGDIGLHDLTTGADRLLTNSGGWEASGDYGMRPVISPDASLIAYSWYVDKEVRTELRVQSLNAARGAQVRIVYRSAPGEFVYPFGWSQNATELFATRSGNGNGVQIGRVSMSDGTFQSIRSLAWSSTNASLSPDDRYIAYDLPVDSKTGAKDIFILAADGSGETVVAKSPQTDIFPIWSPDNGSILFISDRTGAFSLWRVDIQDGKPKGPAQLLKQATGRITPLAITRTGSLYYAVSGANRRNIYSTALDNDLKASQDPTLLVDTFVNSNWGPSISPDGQFLAYYSGRAPVALVTREMKSGTERIIHTNLLNAYQPTVGPVWFADGRSLLVTASELQGPGTSFHRVDVEKQTTELLHHISAYAQGLALAPDGKAFFYATPGDKDSNNGLSLMRFDLETRQATELKALEWFTAVAVSPDSKTLAYVATPPNGPASYIGVMPASGGETRELFRASPWNDGSRFSLSWTSDGNYILFVRGGTNANSPTVLWRVPTAGGPPQQVGLSRTGRIEIPQITQDARRLIFAATETLPGELWSLENFLPGMH